MALILMSEMLLWPSKCKGNLPDAKDLGLKEHKPVLTNLAEGILIIFYFPSSSYLKQILYVLYLAEA